MKKRPMSAFLPWERGPQPALRRLVPCSRYSTGWHHVGGRAEGATTWSSIVLLIVSFAIYFLPAWVAGSRNHHNQMAILALNFFLGWTFVGWVIALVWALTEVNKAQQQSKVSKPSRSIWSDE